MTAQENYTFEDYRNGMPPRAFGSETEFNDTGSYGELYNISNESGGRYGGPPHILKIMNKAHSVSYSNTYGFYDAITVNGGRLYLDCEVIEFATPECRTPQELVLHERLGEVIARETLEQAEEYINQKDINVYKRSGTSAVYIDDKRVIAEDSLGNHENYTSLNEFSHFRPNIRISMHAQSRNAKHFADYLALRKIIDGIGMVDTDGYSISQRPRANDFRQFDGVTKHGTKRPFFQIEDRMEVRTGEGNKSDWAVEFKFGLTSLVLRLVEHDQFPRHLILRDPRKTVRDLSADPLSEVTLITAKKRRGIDALKEIVDAAVELGMQYPEFPAYEKKAANDFYKFYDDLQRVSLADHDVSALSDRIDWAARFEYLVKRGASYETLNTSNLDYVRDDLKWDQLGDRDIARRHFSKFGHTVLRAQILGPPPTRAATRVRLARELFANNTLASVDWNEVVSKKDIRYELKNPLSQDDVYSYRQSSTNASDKED